uniref:RNase H type-1 domain-containing protein n=1 Tax=Fagus sylvatica TaxID=28930 RepID=A0A2N9EHL8_FAGSY
MSLYAQFHDIDSVIRVFNTLEEPHTIAWNLIMKSHLDLVYARKLFDEMSQRDLVSWTSMISGVVPVISMGCFMVMHKSGLESFVQDGYVKNAINLFLQMQSANVEPGAEILRSILDAYTQLGALQLGFGTHGLGSEALELFGLMLKERIKPNGVTFLSLLSACSHSGLVREGRDNSPNHFLIMHRCSSGILGIKPPRRRPASGSKWSTDFPATSVGAVCGKRASMPFTAPIQKDCMVRTRSMEINAQLLPSSSQSPEVAAMEKQCETEREKEKGKGKSKERGDAESRQEHQQKSRQEHQEEHRQEQRQEREGETKGEHTRMSVENSAAKWEQEINMMRVQMGEMKNEFKGRAAKNLDDLVHRTDSPFTAAVISFPLPSKFRMPSLETFDRSKDPLDHLESFKTMMCLQGVPNEIICRAFLTTLKGPAKIWSKKLTPGSVGTFAQLSRSFFDHIIGGQRFNKEMLLVDGADDKVVLIAFISSLQPGDFLYSVYKDPPNSMTEMMYKAQRYMNGEEALQAQDQASGKKRKYEYADRQPESHESKPKMQKNWNRRHKDRGGKGFNERFNHFTPLNAPVDHIFMQIRDDPALKWLGKLTTNPDKRPRDKYCRFHRDHGHNTEDCYDLKKQIEELIKQGKLQRFVERDQREGRQEGHPQGACQQRPPVEASPRPPLREIHVITGGMTAGGTSRSSRKAYACQIHNVLVTQKTGKIPRLEDLPITFIEEDARQVFHPHDDALVVTLEIAGYSMRHILIDNGSSSDIIYLMAFQQMKIGKDQLRPIETPLVGFAGTSVYPLMVISLQIAAGLCIGLKVVVLTVNCPSAYNAIIGPPTLNRLRAVTSTYHLLVRFPTENGIGEMRGDQAMARECYLTSDRDLHDKRDTRFDSAVLERENADIFAWNHDDMPGINTEVIVHKLNVNPSMRPVKQKRRVFAPERNAAVMEEVDKLLTAGFIREVYYPEWLANVVMVKKSTGKWYNMKLNPAKCVFGVSSGKFLGFMVSQRGIEANPNKIKGHPGNESSEDRQRSPSPSRLHCRIHTSVGRRGSNQRKNKAWTVNIDGSSTKEMSGARIVLVSPEKDKLEYPIQLRFCATNNEAEYEALLAGLKLSKNMGVKNLTIKSNSKLIVGQVRGEYEAKDDRMKKYLKVVQTLLPHFENVELLQIPREENVDADQLAKLAS